MTLLHSLLSLAAFTTVVRGIGQDGCVSFESSDSTFPVVSSGNAASIIVSEDDWLGVHRVLNDFASDIEVVTGVRPTITNVSDTSAISGISSTSSPIIVGTLGKSSLANALASSTNNGTFSWLEDKWEAFVSQQVNQPLPGVDSAYVIVGSDKRGTIYALYDLSEQFGVSPWYWWADVQPHFHDELHIEASGCSHGPPSVQYRGIFLNDEAPALTNWAMEKFNNGTGAELTGSPFNSAFYLKVFELILRLKGNYLWPAMWASAFAVDDPLNQWTADMYGIVMGTSHQEPMMRASPPEWDLFGEGPWNYTSNSENVYQYFVEGTERAKAYESLFTLGMRGAGDLPLEESTNIALLEKIVADQRQILTDVFNGTDITTIPQVWALYKEVQAYYEGGMTVPDDVGLLWADDNWGNIRRFPTVDERNRTGGAGVYYHFDYVGDPRNYKWMATTQLARVHEQMSIAYERNATRIWIVNVGDLKPLEREIEFFLNLGWNTTRWTSDNLDSFVFDWAQREFGFDDSDAALAVDIVGNLTRFNSRRKHELLAPTTFSLINYREAENTLAEWDTLEQASTSLYDSLSEEKKPSYFQLVHHNILASSNLGRMMIHAGQNNLRASQARQSTNDLADQVLEEFERDFDLETEYHTILDGKWAHMMDQNHLTYWYWQQPMADVMPPVYRVQKRKEATAGVMRVAIEQSNGAWPGDNPFQCSQGYNCPPGTLTLDSFDPFGNRYLEIGSGGPTPFTFGVEANVSWITISPINGSISQDSPEQRVYVSVSDWSAITDGNATGQLNITANAEGREPLAVSFLVTAENTQSTLSSDFSGFVEGGGVVSFEAAHATRNNAVDGVAWKELPGLGHTLSGVTPYPRGDGNFSAGSGPSLEYNFFNFHTTGTDSGLNVTVVVSPSWNANGEDRPLSFGTQIDSSDVQTSFMMPRAVPGGDPAGWSGPTGFVANNSIAITSRFSNITAGAHTLKLFAIEPAVVVQKIWIDAGGLKNSYLGPPKSLRV